MNSEEAIRDMKHHLMKQVDDIVFAEKHNTLTELKEKVWNRYTLIDRALNRNFRFTIIEGHVNCKRYRHMDYCDVRHRLYSKAEILNWFMFVLSTR